MLRIRFKDGPAAGKEITLDIRDVRRELFVAVGADDRPVVLGSLPGVQSTMPRDTEWSTYWQVGAPGEDSDVRVFQLAPPPIRYGGVDEDFQFAPPYPSSN
jgi:hypothetical protein